MNQVYRLSSGDPFAVTIHPRASVKTWVQDTVLGIRFEHEWAPPITVILPREAAVSTAVALAACGLSSDVTPPADRNDSGAGVGVDISFASESSTTPKKVGGGADNDNDAQAK